MPTPAAAELRQADGRAPAPRRDGRPHDHRAVPAGPDADRALASAASATAASSRPTSTSGRSATPRELVRDVPDDPAHELRRHATGRCARSPYARTWELAQRLRSGAETPFEYILNVNGYLQQGFGYSERPAAPAAGRAPLDAFLIDTKEGYCQHFAGAMALLLRMGGVPARVATGFSPGGFSDRRDAWIVRDTDAHAWVEAWFDEIGWVTFDPTPSSTPARSQIAALEAPPAPIAASDEEGAGAAGGPGGAGQAPNGLRPNLLFDPQRNNPADGVDRGRRRDRLVDLGAARRSRWRRSSGGSSPGGAAGAGAAALTAARPRGRRARGRAPARRPAGGDRARRCASSSSASARPRRPPPTCARSARRATARRRRSRRPPSAARSGARWPRGSGRSAASARCGRCRRGRAEPRRASSRADRVRCARRKAPSTARGDFVSAIRDSATRHGPPTRPKPQPPYPAAVDVRRRDRRSADSAARRSAARISLRMRSSRGSDERST